MQMLIEGFSLVLLSLSALIWCKFVKGAKRFLSPFWFSGVFRRPWAAICLIGGLAFIVGASLTIFAGIPQPIIGDESSYLLAADTFAQGRLTNPPHPLWKHFESLHVIQQPTYASKYPPAQGLALAFGQVFFGHPIVGVWLSAAAACASICWMLCGWVPVRWAWTGGLIAVVRIVLSGPYFIGASASQAYWSQSYWGGAVAALGGALVFGALPRIMKNQKPLDALWLAAGLAILANSRPFEGLVVTLPVIAVLVAWCVRARDVGLQTVLNRVLAPILLVLIPTVLWMGFYNYRVTGHPLLMPYSVHESTYQVAPPFLWMSLRPEPVYNHQVLKELYADWRRNRFLSLRSFHGLTVATGHKILALWCFFVGVLFTPFFVKFRQMLRRRSVQFALGTWALLVAAILSETWNLPHYAAPASSLAILLVVESLRQARPAKWHGRRVGRFLVRATLGNTGSRQTGARTVTK
ncbi:conserved membrane hypothetical protein [Syntrophobacter sp. SbD2]|nr:conserved membrane hypothetical protein [Syntrophobacter sp. SbD2]